MTDNDKILSELAYDLKQGKLKSKQSAFMKHHENLTQVRNYLSLQQISEILRSVHDIDLKPQVISNMMTRVRQKIGESAKTQMSKEKNPEPALRNNASRGIFSKVNEKPKSFGELHDAEADLKKFEDKYK